MLHNIPLLGKNNCCCHAISFQINWRNITKASLLRKITEAKGKISTLNSDSELMLLIYDHCTTISGHFFALCMFLFHKTEVQMVILGCLTALNPNWFTSYDTKSKYFHFRFVVILLKKTHLSFLPFRILCHNFCTN